MTTSTQAPPNPLPQRDRSLLPAASFDSASQKAPRPPSDSSLAFSSVQHSNINSLPGGAQTAATSGNTVIRPRWVRVRSITSGSLMHFSIPHRSPQLPHFRTSTSNPLFIARTAETSSSVPFTSVASSPINQRLRIADGSRTTPPPHPQPSAPHDLDTMLLEQKTVIGHQVHSRCWDPCC